MDTCPRLADGTDCLKFGAAVFNEEMSLYGFSSDAEAAQKASLY